MTSENNQSLALQFTTALQQLVGKPCWAILAGPGTGSVVSLKLGNKIKRDKPIQNKHLTFDEAHYNSEYGLMMIWCSWRLDSHDAIITGNNDPNDNDGPMIKGLENIRATKVTKVECFHPAYDLHITFDNNFTLKLFCDSIDTSDDYPNYYYFTPRGSFAVEPRSTLKFTLKKHNEDIDATT